MVVDHCTDGAECATGAEVGAEVGAGCTKGNQVFAKVKRRSATTPYTHDARNTRRTTHAVPLAGKAWRQSLHRSLMAASGRHSVPTMKRAARNPPVSPPNPRRSPLALAHPWAPPPPTHGHPAHKMSGSAETLGEQRRDAEGAVECPSRRGDVRDPAVAAGSRVGQWSRARSVRRREALVPTRRGAPTRRASRGDKRRKIRGGASGAQSSLMQCPQRGNPKTYPSFRVAVGPVLTLPRRRVGVPEGASLRALHQASLCISSTLPNQMYL